jgi:hypothetical protein
VDLLLFLYPCYRSFGYSLSHQYSYFRWATQETVSPPTTLRTMGRTITTMMLTHHHPLHVLLSKCLLCKHECFKPCNTPWSTCKLLNVKHHHRCRGIGLKIFSAPRRRPFLMLWSQWMLMTSSILLRRSYKWCNVIIMRGCC